MSSPRPTAPSSAPPNHWQNLLWALGAPDVAPEFPLPWLPANRHRALTEFFSRAEIQPQLEPSLLAHLEQLRNHRLGIYFESLWAFAFTHHPDYELLAHNFPIRDQGKTLGELDFVVRHNPDSALEHWEIALKFYLQVGDYWVGPGLRDRLDIKLARMHDHQLPIAHSAAGSATLLASGFRVDRQWALMPGRLFPALTATTDSPAASAYWWTDLTGFHNYLFSSGDWWLLPKPCWLAQIDGDLPSRATRIDEALLTRGPVCVATRDRHGEVSRGFLVPADWHTRALHAMDH